MGKTISMSNRSVKVTIRVRTWTGVGYRNDKVQRTIDIRHGMTIEQAIETVASGCVEDAMRLVSRDNDAQAPGRD
jgi:hypothetical protein